MIFKKIFFLLIACLFLFAACSDTTSSKGNPPVSADNTDTDGDGIPDSQDSDIDGDGISNTDETTFGTDPLKKDTDGDGWEDGVEISLFDSSSDAYKFNPKVADMPRLQVVLEGSPIITMNYETTEGTSESFTTEESESFETSHSTSNSSSHSHATEYGWSVSATFGVQHEFGLEGGTTLSASATVEGHGSYTNEDSYTWEDSQSQSNQTAYARAKTAATETSKSELGGKISVPITIQNNGNIAYTINNLSLAAYKVAPQSGGELGSIITALESEAPIVVTVLPGLSSGMLNFKNDSLYVSEVLDLLADSKGIVCAVSGYSITSGAGTDAGETDFTREGTLVSAQTAKVIIDYGPTVLKDNGAPKPAVQYNVATLYKYNPDYNSLNNRYFPVTMAEIMESLYISYQTGTYDSKEGLISVEGVQSDVANDKDWYVSHVYKRGGQLYHITYAISHISYDFDALEIHTGDTISLIYSEDQDKDGLPARVESLFGTSDASSDSDLDGLTDYEETTGWEISPGTTIYTNPILIDTDMDGFSDSEDTDPNTAYLSSDASIDTYQVNGVDSASLPDPLVINDDHFELTVVPTAPVLFVNANDTFLNQQTSTLFTGFYPDPLSTQPLAIGDSTIDIVVTALDNNNSSTTTLDVQSNLAPVSDFVVSNTETLGELNLLWTKPTDERVTAMLIIEREGAAVEPVEPGLYLEGNTAGDGVIIEKYDVAELLTTEYLQRSGLNNSTTYHYKVLNIREEAGNVYYFSDSVVGSATTGDPPVKTLTFKLDYLRLLETSGEGELEIYGWIIAYLNGHPMGYYLDSRPYFEYVKMEKNEYLAFSNDIIYTSAATIMPKVYPLRAGYSYNPGDQWSVSIQIVEYDSNSGDEKFDNGYDLVLTYDGSDWQGSWAEKGSAPTQTVDPFTVNGSHKTVKYSGGNGEIELKMGIYWE